MQEDVVLKGVPIGALSGANQTIPAWSIQLHGRSQAKPYG